MIDPDVYDDDAFEDDGIRQQVEEVFSSRNRTRDELVAKINNCFQFIQIELSKSFPRELKFFRTNIQKEFVQLAEAYESSHEKALALCSDFYKMWGYVAEGNVFAEKKMNEDFAGQICDIYRDLHDFIYARHKSVS